MPTCQSEAADRKRQANLINQVKERLPRAAVVIARNDGKSSFGNC